MRRASFISDLVIAWRQILYIGFLASAAFLIGNGLLHTDSEIAHALQLPLPQWFGHVPCVIYSKSERMFFEFLFRTSSALHPVPVVIAAFLVARWMSSRYLAPRLISISILKIVLGTSIYIVAHFGYSILNEHVVNFGHQWYLLLDRWFGGAQNLNRRTLAYFAFATLMSAQFLGSFWIALVAMLCVSLNGQRIDESRCAVCGYPLRGLPSRRCPECGTAFESPTPDRRSDESLVE